MKIKISKSQWEEIGRKAGWKTSKGESYVIQDLQGHKGIQWAIQDKKLFCNKCQQPIDNAPIVVDVEWDMSGNDDNYYFYHPQCEPQNIHPRKQ